MTLLQPVALNHALIVEDDPGTRRRMAALLGRVADPERIASVGSMADAKAHAGVRAPDIALVDVGLPDGNGVDFIDWARVHHPGVVCLVLTVHADENTVLRALRAGAVGYMLKDRDDAELEMALRSVARGGAPIDPFVARGILGLLPRAEAAPGAGDAPDASSGAQLSDRECEILELVARGRSNRQIAVSLGLSRFTIEDHTKHIYRKLAVGSRAAAVFTAQSRGLLG